jgi:hypothetical protein
MSLFNIQTLLILGFAAIATAQVMVKLDAPFHLMARFRKVTTIGGLLECIYCSAWWAAIVYYFLLSTVLAPVVYIAAAAGVAMMLWRYTGGEMVS